MTSNQWLTEWNFQQRIIHDLRRDINHLMSERSGETWFWQGDEEDHLESLTCLVVIPADVLRDLLAKEYERGRSNTVEQVNEWMEP